MIEILHILFFRKGEWRLKVKKGWGLALATLGMLLTMGTAATKADAAVPDISEWQTRLSATQVRSLKSQVSFVINRVQYGAGYEDITHRSNESLYVKYGVPFGSYDFATFSSAGAARTEAQRFYARTNKNTRFYVLDFETNNGMGSGTANAAVKAWYAEMRKLTNKKLIFYSYQSFATTYANAARGAFDAQWIANYSYRPTVSFSMWQYTSAYHFNGLKYNGKPIDFDNNLVDGHSVTAYHPISWWTNGKSARVATHAPAKAVATSKPAATPKPAKPKTYAYSNYAAGQYAYLNSGASNYEDRSRVPKSVKRNTYRITAVHAMNRSHSKQAVYLAGLNKWVLAQDVTGYWRNGASGRFTLRFNANIYNDQNLKVKSGRRIAKGATVTGKVIKVGRLYRVQLNGGGYITAQVKEANFVEVKPAKTYAYSSYKAGQYAYLNSAATHYYDQGRVPKKAKQKTYRITAVRGMNRSHSKQAVYLAGLNKWVLSQDVTGYWWQGSRGRFQLRFNANIYRDKKLKQKSGRRIAKNAVVTGHIVKVGKLYRIQLNGGGYITAQVRETNYLG